ncbi:glycosyltransferase [Algoriphagus sp. NG3]|uniref:glycosyltransferase n=1 Tax=Algoriphagus sp. NG3 TaxID=3097546 RepID=UPI002A8322EE|nr:glycosyltransferase [Algoriphagus sp. NG3]WPR77809.1 glycosyltransferase [Algoriphagus sp. NG3]
MAPCIVSDKISEIDIAYHSENIEFVSVPSFDFLNPVNAIKALGTIPLIFWRILRTMGKAYHIHLRCPGNMGLLGSIAQLFFPGKKKSAKYAGNWDWSIRQPKSYRVQQFLLRSTFLTKNMKVLVYGEWPDKTKNILPFFTASYSDLDVLPFVPRKIGGVDTPVELIFVGTLSKNKNPDICIEVVKLLKENKIPCNLHLFGEGPLRKTLEELVHVSALEDCVTIHGNKPAEYVKQYYQRCHFLVFISDSEGWPKVVAEAMFWGCLPITTKVSCVPQMLDFGSRGVLVSKDPIDIYEQISLLINSQDEYNRMARTAHEWSTGYTLEKFEMEIGNVIND